MNDAHSRIRQFVSQELSDDEVESLHEEMEKDSSLEDFLFFYQASERLQQDYESNQFSDSRQNRIPPRQNWSPYVVAAVLLCIVGYSIINSIVTADDSKEWVGIDKGWEFMEKGEFEKALTELETTPVRTEEPNKNAGYRAVRLKMTCLFNLGRHEEAVNVGTRFIESNSWIKGGGDSYAQLILKMVQSLEEDGKYGAAIVKLQEAKGAPHVEDTTAYVIEQRLVYSLAAVGREEEAIATARSSEHFATRLIEYQKILDSLVGSDINKYEASLALLPPAIDDSTRKHKLEVLAGQVYAEIKSNKTEKAEKVLSEIVALAKAEDVNILRESKRAEGLIRFQQGRFQEARMILVGYLENKTEFASWRSRAESSYLIAKSSFELNDIDEAKRFSSEALAIANASGPNTEFRDFVLLEYSSFMLNHGNASEKIVAKEQLANLGDLQAKLRNKFNWLLASRM